MAERGVLSGDLIKNGFIAHDLMHGGSMMHHGSRLAIVAQEEGGELQPFNSDLFEQIKRGAEVFEENGWKFVAGKNN